MQQRIEGKTEAEREGKRREDAERKRASERNENKNAGAEKPKRAPEVNVRDLPEDFPQKLDLMEGNHPHQPFEKSGYLFLPGKDGLRAVPIDKIPLRGWQEHNGFYVTSRRTAADSLDVQVEQKRPLLAKDIEADWIKRNNLPIHDSFGKKTAMDPQLLSREKRNNTMLNGWFEKYLSRGDTVKEAHNKVAKDAQDTLKITIVPMIGISL